MAAGSWTSGAGIGDVNQALQTTAIVMAIDETIKNMGIIGAPTFQQILAMDEGLGPMFGALGISLGVATVGTGKMASTAEGTAVAATNWSAANATVTPARRELGRVVSDYARSLNDPLLSGELGPSAIATLIRDGLGNWSNTYVDLVAALAASASYSSGTSGAAYTWNALHHLTIDMADRGAGGPKVALLSAKGVKDLGDDALSLGGAVQMAAQVQQFLQVGTMPGMSAAYVGRFFGSTDLYMCSELDTDGGDTLGVAFSADGVQSKHQPVRLPAEAMSIFQSPMFSIEGRRTGGSVSRFDQVTYNGVGIKQQKAFAKIVYATA